MAQRRYVIVPAAAKAAADGLIPGLTWTGYAPTPAGPATHYLALAEADPETYAAMIDACPGVRFRFPPVAQAILDHLPALDVVPVTGGG